MAHFAKIDENNLVVAVHVVANKDILDDSGNESEAKGIEFLTKLHKQDYPLSMNFYPLHLVFLLIRYLLISNCNYEFLNYHL